MCGYSTTFSELLNDSTIKKLTYFDETTYMWFCPNMIYVFSDSCEANAMQVKATPRMIFFLHFKFKIFCLVRYIDFAMHLDMYYV